MREAACKLEPKTRTFAAAFAILCAAALGLPGTARAQAPAGPLAPTQPSDSRSGGAAAPAAPAKPPVQPRTSIFGAWRLNRDDSEDPRQRAQESRGGGGGGNRRTGGGYPGGGGGYGGGRMGGGQGMSDEDRQRMQELMAPANGLTIAEAKKNVEVDAFDDQERKRAFFTDGRKLHKSKDSIYQEIAAHWDGARLVTDEKNPRGGKMSRTYELSYDGTQLYETLHMTVGRNNTPLVVRFVYDQAPGGNTSASPATSPAPAPSAPARQPR